MIYYTITGILLLLSLAADRRKTIEALRIAWKRFSGIVPVFLLMLVFVSITLYFLPREAIARLLGADDPFGGLLIAMVVGSITLMPGFIAYPLCGILRSEGVPFMVLSGFTTTLMMVGILTFPVEKAYFGTRTTILRNLVSLLTALVIAIVTGLVFGDLTP